MSENVNNDQVYTVIDILVEGQLGKLKALREKFFELDIELKTQLEQGLSPDLFTILSTLRVATTSAIDIIDLLIAKAASSCKGQSKDSKLDLTIGPLKLDSLGDPINVQNILDTQPLIEAALAAVHRGLVGQGRIIAETILKLSPNNPSASACLALSYLVVDRFDMAETILIDILKKIDYPEAKALLALTYKFSGRSDEARNLFTQVSQQGGPSAKLAEEILSSCD
ncbi:MAG: hypothetical protein LBV23_10745 [Deltaproteobacteria bacterium]|jgi:hypothetical protein|nr:hypothetical protein [Deltaproteobacteria bacterium]